MTADRQAEDKTDCPRRLEGQPNMKTERIGHRWRLIRGEVEHRWPALPVSELNRTAMPDGLPAVLSRHYEISLSRAITEVSQFWAELDERFQRAA